jgi:tetratricopeptide (TPR) repeat protein
LDEYALTCYQQALRLAPNSAKINRQIGYYYLSKGNKAQGKDYLSRSFQLNPNQPDVAGELGRLGVVVKVPRKVQKQTKKLDKIVEESDKSYQEK